MARRALATARTLGGGSYVEWSAVIAGAIGASAISFLLLTFGGAIGLSLAGYLRMAEAGAIGPAKAQSAIVVWLGGGPSHFETFDPKPDAPAEIRGEFQPIETSVSGLRVCEHLPQLARRLDKLAAWFESKTGLRLALLLRAREWLLARVVPARSRRAGRSAGRGPAFVSH